MPADQKVGGFQDVDFSLSRIFHPVRSLVFGFFIVLSGRRYAEGDPAVLAWNVKVTEFWGNVSLSPCRGAKYDYLEGYSALGGLSSPCCVGNWE